MTPWRSSRRAGARDSAGLETEAEPLYRRALAAGLDEERRVQAVIQLASTLRNLGRVDESLALLQAEYERGRMPSSTTRRRRSTRSHSCPAGDAVAAASVALQALAPHLPRYTRSVSAYARELA